MRLTINFDVEGPARRFIEEEWPLMLGHLYTMPHSVILIEDDGTAHGLSIALPTKEGQVKP